MIPPVIGIQSPPTLGIMGGLLVVLGGLLNTPYKAITHMRILLGFQKLTEWGVAMIPSHKDRTKLQDLGQAKDPIGPKEWL